MKNYVIRFQPRDMEKTIDVIRQFSNDVQIDHLEDHEVGVTIELEDDPADKLFRGLQEEIDRQLATDDRQLIL